MGTALAKECEVRGGSPCRQSLKNRCDSLSLSMGHSDQHCSEQRQLLQPGSQSGDDAEQSCDGS